MTTKAPNDSEPTGEKKTSSRSDRRRGPKKAPPRPVRAPSRAVAAPYGGFPLDDAERHLVNYREDGSIEGRNEAFFRLTRALVVAARRWRKLANDRIKPLKQTMARWETLYLVAYSGEELTQGELARLISIEGPSMVHMLDALARDGLIERQQHLADRRVTTNRITDEGRQTVRDIMGITNELRADLLENIDPHKLDIAVEVLGDILKRLDEMQ